MAHKKIQQEKHGCLKLVLTAVSKLLLLASDLSGGDCMLPTLLLKTSEQCLSAIVRWCKTETSEQCLSGTVR